MGFGPSRPHSIPKTAYSPSLRYPGGPWDEPWLFSCIWDKVHDDTSHVIAGCLSCRFLLRIHHIWMMWKRVPRGPKIQPRMMPGHVPLLLVLGKWKSLGKPWNFFIGQGSFLTWGGDDQFFEPVHNQSLQRKGLLYCHFKDCCCQTSRLVLINWSPHPLSKPHL